MLVLPDVPESRCRARAYIGIALRSRTGQRLGTLAVMDRTPRTAPTPEQRAFWAFQPVKAPAVPVVKDAHWARNDVDKFLLARMEAEGLAPAPAEFNGRVEQRYVRVCPDADGRYRVEG